MDKKAGRGDPWSLTNESGDDCRKVIARSLVSVWERLVPQFIPRVDEFLLVADWRMEEGVELV